MIKTVNFHVGLHKTGTTFVQKVYQDQGLADSKVAYMGPETKEYAALRGLLLQARNGVAIDMNSLGAEFEAIRKKLSGVEELFISDENIIGATPLSYAALEEKVLYPALERQVNIIENIFKNYNLVLHVTTRPYISFLKSMYLDGLKYLRYGLTFDEYIDHFEIDTFHPNVIANRVSDAYSGVTKVHRVDRTITMQSLKEMGLVHQKFAVDQPQPPRANSSLPLAKASLSRIFGNIPVDQRESVRRWLDTCPVTIHDKNLKFKDVELSAHSVDKLKTIDFIVNN